MIIKKTPAELGIMAQGGRILAGVKRELCAMTKPGVSGREIDRRATELIRTAGAELSFAMEPGYHWATCIDINDGTVHGVPSDYRFVNGDIVGIDVGVFFRGFHTDTSVTVGVGPVSAGNRRFLEAGKYALAKALQTAKPGRCIADISRVIETTIRTAGYAPVAALSGHGIGRKLHEDPLIPCITLGSESKSPLIEVGMALAIEIIYTAGTGEVAYKGSGPNDSDGWTIVSADGTIAGEFEETVIMTARGPRVIT
jgi:methionyl aminopeptidase